MRDVFNLPEDAILRIGEFAHLVGVHPQTVRRWVAERIIPFETTPTGEHRIRKRVATRLPSLKEDELPRRKKKPKPLRLMNFTERFVCDEHHRKLMRSPGAYAVIAGINKTAAGGGCAVCLWTEAETRLKLYAAALEAIKDRGDPWSRLKAYEILNLPVRGPKAEDDEGDESDDDSL